MNAQLFALLELGLLLLVGKLSEEAFSKLGLTSFVGAILAGIILGPGLTGALYPSPYVSEFISLGIVFILFMAGVEERPSLSNARPVVAGLLAFMLSFVLIYMFSTYALKLGYEDSLVTGIVLGMVSAGPFSRTIGETSDNAKRGRDLLIETLSMEIAAVVFFSFIATKAISISSEFAAATIRLLAVIIIIVAFSKFILHRILRWIEIRFKSWEAPFGVLVGMILIVGFVAESVGFNSAIAAFLLGAFASTHIKENAYLLEKLRAITFGFFEPMFFMGLGLYMTKLTPYLFEVGIAAFALSLAAKAASASAVNPLVKTGTLKNMFAISHEGGVDGAILLTALQLSLIAPATYSLAIIAVTIFAVMAPVGYRGIAPAKERPTVSPVKFVEYRLSGTTTLELSKTLPTVAVNENDPIIKALRLASSLDARVMAVVDSEGRPAGYVNVHDMFRVASYGLEDEPVSSVQVNPIPKIRADEPASRALDEFRLSESQIIAVVDDDGKLVGTILEREVLRYLLSSG